MKLIKLSNIIIPFIKQQRTHRTYRSPGPISTPTRSTSSASTSRISWAAVTRRLLRSPGHRTTLPTSSSTQEESTSSTHSSQNSECRRDAELVHNSVWYRDISQQQSMTFFIGGGGIKGMASKCTHKITIHLPTKLEFPMYMYASELRAAFENLQASSENCERVLIISIYIKSIGYLLVMAFVITLAK